MKGLMPWLTNRDLVVLSSNFSSITETPWLTGLGGPLLQLLQYSRRILPVQTQAIDASVWLVAPVGIDADGHFVGADAETLQRKRHREGLHPLVGPDVVVPAPNRDVIERESSIADGLVLRGRILEQGRMQVPNGPQNGGPNGVVGDVDPQFDFLWGIGHETDWHFIHGGVLDDEFGGCDGAR